MLRFFSQTCDRGVFLDVVGKPQIDGSVSGLVASQATYNHMHQSLVYSTNKYSQHTVSVVLSLDELKERIP